MLAIYCLVFSLVWHLVAAWMSVGYNHPDEEFQIIEFASYKLGFSPLRLLAWEYHERLRPAMQPALIVGLMKLMGAHASPVICTYILRFFSTLLGWASLWFIVLISIKYVKGLAAKRLLLFASALFWYLPYIHAHFHSESISGSLFFLGAGCLWLASERDEKYFIQPNMLALLGGFLLGLSFVCRFQTGFMIFGTAIWCIFVARFSIWKIFLIIFPALVAFGIGLIIDHWFYGEWVCTAWNYYKENLLQGKAASFGTLPWWTYFEWMGRDLILPFSIPVMAAVLYSFFIYPKNIIVLSFIPFVLVHIIIGHKEPRFLFPLADGVPVLLALAYSQFVGAWAAKLWWKVCFGIFWFANGCVLVSFACLPAQERFGMYDYIYEHYNGRSPIALSKDVYLYSISTMSVCFYQPRDLKVFEFVNDTRIDSFAKYAASPVIMAFGSLEDTVPFKLAHPSARRVYSTVPIWITKFNINNWTSRARIWTVYELNQK